MSTYRSKHVIVWEKENGPVPEGKRIHHINGNHRDNRVENLRPVTPGEHSRLHSKNYRFKDNNIIARRCTTCRKWMTLDKFYKYRTGYYAACKKCHGKTVENWQDRNKSKLRDNLKAWRKTHPDKVAEQNKRRAPKIRQWQTENIEHLREYGRQWRLKRKEAQ